MEEQNPLQTSIEKCTLNKLASRNSPYNKSGRPRNKQIIKFGPQPESIIARLLKKIKEDEALAAAANIDVEESHESDILQPENCSVELQPEDEDILCQECSYRSSSMKEHRKHIKTHKDKLFSCDYQNCSYTCKLSSNMIKHKRVHTSEKPYLCDQCSFRSNFVNSLKVHRRIHTDERPYSCNHCSYRCNSSSNLKKHCRHRHWDDSILKV